MFGSEYSDDVDGRNLWNSIINGGDAAAEEAAQGQQYFAAAAVEEGFQNPPPDSGGFDGYYHSHHHDRDHQSGVVKIKLLHGEEEEVGESRAYSSLGLNLSMTASLIDLVEQRLNDKGKKPISPPASSGEDCGSQAVSEKLKATHFPAKYLRIGKWERESRHEGDLVAKCYYAKKKLVWEILEGALKSKIEIQWNDIAGIRATCNDGRMGILEIELNQVPTFHKETDPQPRKHTLWQQADDFTGSEALKNRIHHVRCAPEILGKHYNKLLESCPRLASLSQRPFPSLPTPFFEPSIQNPYQQPSHPFFLQGYGAPYLPPPHHHTFQNYPFPIQPSFPNPQISSSNPQISGGAMEMGNGMTHWVNNNGTIQPFQSAQVNNMDFPSHVPNTHGMVFNGGLDRVYANNLGSLDSVNRTMSFDESYENGVTLQHHLSFYDHHEQRQQQGMTSVQDDLQHALTLSSRVGSDPPLNWDVDDGSNGNLMLQPPTTYSSATMYTYPPPHPSRAYNNNPNM